MLKFRSGSENVLLTAGIKNQFITVFLTSDTQEKKSFDYSVYFFARFCCDASDHHSPISFTYISKASSLRNKLCCSSCWDSAMQFSQRSVKFQRGAKAQAHLSSRLLLGSSSYNTLLSVHGLRIVSTFL